jgi:hypothetical protein
LSPSHILPVQASGGDGRASTARASGGALTVAASTSLEPAPGGPEVGDPLVSNAHAPAAAVQITNTHAMMRMPGAVAAGAPSSL